MNPYLRAAILDYRIESAKMGKFSVTDHPTFAESFRFYSRLIDRQESAKNWLRFVMLGGLL